MPVTPPTSPGPLPRNAGKPLNPILLGMLIEAGFAFITCVGVPLVMGSNIWPIAAVFWMALTVPPALGIGALLGLALRRTTTEVRLTTLIATGAILAVMIGSIMAQS